MTNRSLRIVCAVCGTLAITNLAVAEQPARSVVVAQQPFVVATQATVRGRLVQHGSPQPLNRRQLKALEEYYDDLEDFYDDRDPYLAEYYERLENYYEDLRKGKPAFLPVAPSFVEFHSGGPPIAEPHWPAPALPGEVIQNAEPIPAPGPPGENRTLNRPVDLPHVALERAYRQLISQLDRLTTGESWQRFLQLPFNTAGGGLTSDGVFSDAVREQLRAAVAKYEQIHGNANYRVVTQLPAFERTRAALVRLIELLDNGPQLPQPAGDEALPVPGPNATAPQDGTVVAPQLF